MDSDFDNALLAAHSLIDEASWKADTSAINNGVKP